MLAHRYLEDMEAYPAHKQPATTRHKLICLHLREHTWHIRRSNAHSRQFCRSQWCEIATPAVSCFYGSERESGETCILRGFLKGTYFRSAGRPNNRFSPEWPINRVSLWKWRSEGGMMERLPQRFCSPSELGNPQRTRVSTFPQRRRLRLSNRTKLLNPRKSRVSPDSRAEPFLLSSRVMTKETSRGRLTITVRRSSQGLQAHSQSA